MDYAIRKGRSERDWVVYNKRTGMVLSRGHPSQEVAKQEVIRVYNYNKRYAGTDKV